MKKIYDCLYVNVEDPFINAGDLNRRSDVLRILTSDVFVPGKLGGNFINGFYGYGPQVRAREQSSRFLKAISSDSNARIELKRREFVKFKEFVLENLPNMPPHMGKRAIDFLDPDLSNEDYSFLWRNINLDGIWSFQKGTNGRRLRF